jgi:hypothetical protein
MVTDPVGRRHVLKRKRRTTMRRVFVLLLACAALWGAGCSSKKSKCQKGWSYVTDMAKGVSGLVGLVGKAIGKPIDLEAKVKEVEPKFMEACMQLPDDAMDCVANFKDKMLDPKCIMTLAKLPKLM